MIVLIRAKVGHRVVNKLQAEEQKPRRVFGISAITHRIEMVKYLGCAPRLGQPHPALS
jgi:hypothetical protein